MRVYLGGPYAWKDRISKCAEEARAAGIEITSGWLEEPHKPDTQLADLDEQTHELYANRDLEDIDRADVFVLFAVPATDTPIPRAGRHVEFGYALHARIPIYVVGNAKENIFHHLPGRVKHVENWDAALEILINRAVEAMGL